MAKHLVIILLISMAVFAGCNRPDSPEFNRGAEAQFVPEQTVLKKDWVKSLFGPGPANYESIFRQAAPYDPATEANVTGKSFRSLNTPHQTIEDDQTVIEQALFQMEGVTPMPVILAGSHAWVNISVENYNDMPKEQKDKLKEDIEHHLQQVNPRYSYEINVHDFQFYPEDS